MRYEKIIVRKGDNKMKKFEEGKKYTHGWIGDSDLFTTWEVIKRTATTITIKSEEGTKTCNIVKDLSEMDGRECVRPYGKYSMCPILRA